MAGLLPEVEILSEMHGGVALAFDLLLYLGRRTLMNPGKYCLGETSLWLVDRDVFDDPADEMLHRLATCMPRAAVTKEHLAELTLQRRVFRLPQGPLGAASSSPSLYIQGRDITQSVGSRDTYFPTSYALIWSLVVGQSVVEAHAEDLKQLIRRKYTEISDDIRVWGLTSNQLSCTMQSYIPAVRRLISMRHGRKLASSIFLFMSKKSIPPIDVPREYSHHSRPSDAALDEELVHLCTTDNPPPTYFELKALVEENKILEQHNIYTYLPRYRALLAERLSSDIRPESKELALQLLPKDAEIPPMN